MTYSPNDDDRLWKETQHEGWFRFASPLRYVVFLILLIGIVILIWYLTSSTRRSFDKAELALIRADENPYKVKAKDQDLPNIKHQDKLVYGRIRNDQNTPTVEHILPDPEPPVVQIKEDSSNLKMVNQYTPEDIELEKVEEAAPQDSKESFPNHKVVSIEDLIEEDPFEKPIQGRKTTKGNILIQLGSLKSQDMAELEWKRISEKHKDILGGLDPTIQKVDLGTDQGIYYLDV